MVGENKIRVLVADNQEDYSTKCIEILEADIQEHYQDVNVEFITVNNGGDAVRVMRANDDVDIIILDYFFSDIEGDEVVSQIREFNKDVYILINSEFSNEEKKLISKHSIMRELDVSGCIVKGHKCSNEELIMWFTSGIRQSLKTKKIKKLSSLASKDVLTGLYNRSLLFALGQQSIHESVRFNKEFYVLSIDIDHFKKINEQYGHGVGDEILKHITKMINDSVRVIDVVGRYGGEEFAVLLSETDIAGAKITAERIRNSVEKNPISEISVTVSISIAERKDDIKITELFKRADSLLIKAKESGRNKIMIEE